MTATALARSLRALLTAGLCAGLVFGLAACGKKGSPKPPAGEESQYTYPQAYPAPETVVPGSKSTPAENAGPLSIFSDDERTKTTAY
ncbi:MAG: hypothetical protein Kow00114_07380 [Kiloniellaceae bacterium]